MTTQNDARKYVSSLYAFGKGPCLVARPGSNLPSCHERDFCSCEIEEAFLAGEKRGLQRALDEFCSACNGQLDGGEDLLKLIQEMEGK